MAVAVRPRRLAGIAFETQPPPRRDVLPRMDVAGLVGFAASGPVNVPVPVEDAAAFAEIFGGDAPLALDPQRGTTATALLAPAVRAFFRNGGRRAWIVRVAGPGARTTLFPLPDLVVNRDGKVRAAVLPARSVGSWSDGLQVETALVSRPAVLAAVSEPRLFFRIEVQGPEAIVPGDVLRLRHDPYELLAAVQTVEPARALPSDVAPGRTVLRVQARRSTALWLERRDPPIGAAGRARLVGLDGRGRYAPARVLSGSTRARVELEVEAAWPSAPAPGSLVSVTHLPAELPRQLFVRADDVRPRDGRFVVAGEPYWILRRAPRPRPLVAGDSVERLSVELRARLGRRRWALAELGLAPGHPRYLGDLPTDEELYARTEGEVQAGEPPALWRESAEPRFPLAGRDLAEHGVYYPVGMRASPRQALGAERQGGSALRRDGLQRFDDTLFLDPALRGRRTPTLLATADHVGWQAPRPRPLIGIHALLGIDEVTLVAVPDAAQPGWRPGRRDPTPPPPASTRAPCPDRSRFGHCAARVLPGTAFAETPRPDATGSFRLAWDPSAEPGARFVVEETTDPRDWAYAASFYAGPATSVELYSRRDGT